ncbi:MAG: right-handed parallel beta-helix repeat-containing protein [Deltaproteobacteria bacterium]|nr:right-handed parallel beta-helix repeat-containing protein [Deltaproteobacteria bacterium]
MRAIRKAAVLVLVLSTILIGNEAVAGGLNIPEDSNGGRICKVTSMVDDAGILGSLRRALEQGYNIQDSSLPSFCTEKIVFDTAGTITLRDTIRLNNKAAAGFALEKGAGVSGQVILDASGLGEGACAIELDSNQVTIKGITVRGAAGSGICIKGGSNGNLIDGVSVTRSGNGILVESGSQRNTIQNGFFFDNTGFGVKLNDATQNQVTRNALYRNNQGPIDSPATNIRPTISSAAPTNSAATNFTLSGTLPEAVDRIEIFRGAPSGSETNFIVDLREFSGLSFLATVDARAGEEVFAVGIAPDGTTSPASAIVRLSATGGGGTGPGTGPRPCFPGQIFPPTADFDGDGIFDVNEDKNKNCVVDPGETDPANEDTDGDTITDGIEDRNKNGVLDEGESNPTLIDSDSDGLPDNVEDRNKNGIRDFGELDPSKEDTDEDGIIDLLEDMNGNGVYDAPAETNGTRADSDFDGLADGIEDKNRNGILDLNESDPRKADTDGDGLLDNLDPCPQNTSTSCEQPCVPGIVPEEDLDNDNDGIPDIYEDINHNCIVDAGETDAFDRDTDGDGRNDRLDACPNNPDLTCEGECNPDSINPFTDSDSDGLPNAEEDLNSNCFVDPNESDPFDPDTDRDGTKDGNDTCPLDPNPLCANECVAGVEPPEAQDSDGDGIPDKYEDINRDCIQGPNETNFRKRDTDGDIINDNEDPCPLNPDANCSKECIPGEFIPPQRDSDRDGIKDVLEDTNKNCIRDVGESDAYSNDTDGDGLPDGQEDRNQNGLFEPGESDPRNLDTDGDGLQDGVEDRNKNGIVDFDELDPKVADTDGDGILDFNEDANRNGVWDAGETNGARKDTDQDGLEDGAEDANKNGFVDAGETDPRNPDSDGDGATDGQEVSLGTNPINASESDLNKALGRGCALNAAGSAPAGFGAYLGAGLLGLLGLRLRRAKK